MNMFKKRLKATILKCLRIPAHIFWIFPVKKNRIIFQSFRGVDYSDSCKAMIEYFHKFYPGRYEMYWVTIDDSNLTLPNYKELHCVKRHTVKYFYLCFTAKVAICNIYQECSLPLKKSQKLVNVWHGMPYKTVGLARLNDNRTPDFNVYTLFLSPCEFYTDEVIRRSFNFIGSILNCGLPRNDILFRLENEELKASIYKLYQIESKVKIVLFAPTFRGNFEDINTHLDFNRVIDALQNRWGGEWVLMYRAHPMLVRKDEKIEGAINATFYPDIMELLVVSDVLITDYSSSMWDFALTRKPVFLYAPDLKDYSGDRGFYVDMEKLPFKLGHDNSEIENNIVMFDENRYRDELEIYFKKMGSFEHGNACEALATEIGKWCN